MKNTLFASILGIILVGILSFTGCRSRESHESYSERRAGWVVDKISDELDLNETQKLTVNRIKGEVLAKRGEFKSLYAGVVDEVLQQVKSDKVDQESINKSFQAREAKLKELRSFVVEKFAEFHSVLTPDQRKQLADKLEHYRKRGG
ncbi:MAG: Spy/CpxP family protein refolding chaperone [Ignavibacteriales bacterium]|nr:Spy/CpxP family protein refolding chaperone [Ignavibacteriales bacterium]